MNCISHGVRRFAGSGVALLGLLFAAPTTAHLKIVQGRLIDLVQRSDVIVIGTITGERPASPQTADVVVHVDRVLAGKLNASTVAARSAADFAPTMRDVLFLRRVGSGWESIAPAGTVFPTQPHDDAAYRQTITAIRRALRHEPATRIQALRAALLPALSASAPPLRYHAALELHALTHAGHPLLPRERHTLERLVADAHTDPALRPLLSGLLRLPPP